MIIKGQDIACFLTLVKCTCDNMYTPAVHSRSTPAVAITS